MGVTPAELLQQLLDVCHESAGTAARLAPMAEAEPLRQLLNERARQYERAVDEVRAACAEQGGTLLRPKAGEGAAAEPASDDVAAAWEQAECAALTYFRDVYDVVPPSRLADTVKRHYAIGVRGLEELRALQSLLAEPS